MEATRIKGDVVAVFNTDEQVEIWVASPTGDSSDSHIFSMRCTSVRQAEEVVARWKAAWGL
jgi:hypothetical protein